MTFWSSGPAPGVWIVEEGDTGRLYEADVDHLGEPVPLQRLLKHVNVQHPWVERAAELAPARLREQLGLPVSVGSPDGIPERGHPWPTQPTPPMR